MHHLHKMPSFGKHFNCSSSLGTDVYCMHSPQLRLMLDLFLRRAAPAGLVVLNVEAIVV